MAFTEFTPDAPVFDLVPAVVKHNKIASLIGAACGFNCGPDSDTYVAAAYLQEVFDHISRDAVNFPQLSDRAEFNRVIDEMNFDDADCEYSRTRAFSEELAHAVSTSIQEGEFPIVVGGDHSCAIGTWRGVTAHTEGAIGLIWIDAHMDSHTDETSHSGAIHGMPLASLIGFGNGHLAADWKHGQAVDPNFTTLIGVRSYEPEERAFLESHGVTIVYADPDNPVDYLQAFKDAVSLASRCPNGFGITFDLDVLDPVDMPQVACYVPDGLSWNVAESMMQYLTPEHKRKLLAFEIVEFAPNIANFNEREQVLSGNKDPITSAESAYRVFQLIETVLK